MHVSSWFKNRKIKSKKWNQRQETTVQINECFELIEEQNDEIEKMEFETASIKETWSWYIVLIL